MRLSILSPVGLLLSTLLISNVVVAQSGSAVHWGYTGHAGPENWAELNSDFELCGDGREQSPVNITNDVPLGEEKIEFHYTTNVSEVLNNGHTIQANVKDGSYIKVGGKRFELLQFHFHSPSENTLDDSPYAMEMHLVHKSKQGKLAVVGVFLEKGATNKSLADIWKFMPAEANEKTTFNRVKVNPANILPSRHGYYSFAGSLTTPPCSEGVKWMVLTKPISVSKKQVEKFLSIIGENARPVQERDDFGTAKKSEHKNVSHGSSHWEYSGAQGPGAWGDIKNEFELCGNGKNQSPINIEKTSAKVLDQIKFSYQNTPVEILNNGHTIQANYLQGSYMEVAGKRYELLQFHFHSPSEHKVKGSPVPLEMHLVHKSREGELAVVGVMFDSGRSNKLLSPIWNNMPDKANVTNRAGRGYLNATDFLPDDQSYYFYNGSLTTPPCSEGVKWFVMQNTSTVSSSQVRKFVKVIGKNARPVQSVNSRHVRKGVSAGAAGNNNHVNVISSQNNTDDHNGGH
ncbi:MAG: carbonic anhydrase family protein [Gammaproteobacteria bacterium]|nr:carbonic anhydrase family protein [Gammaproteobacteria bacterium]